MARKQKRWHYIYKTTNLINSKFYVGMHSTNDLNDGYIGSGKYLWNSIRKYGKENFKVDILEFFDSREELKKREKNLVNEELLKDSNCMNITLGGGGDWYHVNSNSDIQRAKGIKANTRMKILRETEPEWVKRKSKSQSIGQKESYKNGRVVNVPDWTGRNHRKETIEKLKGHTRQVGIKNSQYKTCWIHNNELKKSTRIKKDKINEWLSKGWKLGAVFNWEKYFG